MNEGRKWFGIAMKQTCLVAEVYLTAAQFEIKHGNQVCSCDYYSKLGELTVLQLNLLILHALACIKGFLVRPID